MKYMVKNFYNLNFKKCFIILFIIFTFFIKDNIYATEKSAIENTEETVNLKEYISVLEDYLDKNGSNNIDVDLNDIYNNLKETKNIDYNSVLKTVLGVLFKSLRNVLTGSITIFFIMLLLSVLSSLKLDEDSSVTKISNLVCYILIITIMMKNFLEVITSIKETVNIVATLMQVTSPFLLGIIIATGAVTTTGIIEPLLLFVASSIGFVVTYIIIPFLNISFAFKIITLISENIKLDELSNFFSSSSKWLIVVLLTLFLGVLTIVGNLSTSIDAVFIKTTQAAVSNFVPVVGKFFSDSFESVVASSKLILNVSGILGIIVVFFITITPILKVLSIIIVYSVLAGSFEILSVQKKIIDFIKYITNLYKTILGILIGVDVLFIISIGVVINLTKVLGS